MAFWRKIPAASGVLSLPDDDLRASSQLQQPHAPSFRDVAQTVIQEGREQHGKNSGGERVTPRTIRREPSMVKVVAEAVEKEKERKKGIALGSLLRRRKSKSAIAASAATAEAQRRESAAHHATSVNRTRSDSDSGDDEQAQEEKISTPPKRRDSVRRPSPPPPTLARAKTSRTSSSVRPSSPSPSFSRPAPSQRRTTLLKARSPPPSRDDRRVDDGSAARGGRDSMERRSTRPKFVPRGDPHYRSESEEDEEDRYRDRAPNVRQESSRVHEPDAFVPPPSLAHRSPPSSPRSPPMPPAFAPRPTPRAAAPPPYSNSSFRPAPAVPYQRASPAPQPAAYLQRSPPPPRLAPNLAPPPLRRHNSDFAITGLSNLGNTCYMSAVLQCLAATEPFASFLTSGDYKLEINKKNTWGTRGALSKATAQLFKAMRGGEAIAIAPHTFRDTFGSFKPDFDDSSQCDAQEMLGYLLDGLHEDLNLVLERPPPTAPKSPEMEERLERMPEVVVSDLEWEKHLDLNDSIVVDLFQGQFRSRLTCLTCRHTSTTFNAFQTLSLPIPMPTRQHRTIELADCINAFLRSELMDGEDAWNCPRCRIPRPSSKWLSISRLPQILIIHLKRFASFDTISEKIETPVEFPLVDVELGDLLPSVPQGLTRRCPAEHEGQATYGLYGVINHYPQRRRVDLGSGHYTAMVKRGDEWLEVDDDVVEVIDEEVVAECSQSAYLLFYRLQQ